MSIKPQVGISQKPADFNVDQDILTSFPIVYALNVAIILV